MLSLVRVSFFVLSIRSWGQQGRADLKISIWRNLFLLLVLFLLIPFSLVNIFLLLFVNGFCRFAGNDQFARSQVDSFDTDMMSCRCCDLFGKRENGCWSTVLRLRPKN